MLQVKIKAPTTGQLRRLHKFNVDFKEHSMHLNPNISHYEVFAIINNEQKSKLESVGYRVEVISDLVEIAKRRLEEVSRIDRFLEVQDMAKLRELAFGGGYMNVDEVETALTKIHDLNPEMVSIVELPKKTWENRTCRAIHVHTGANNSTRPALMFTGGMHGREWGTSDICVNFIANLIDAYNSNAEIKYGNKRFSSRQIKSILDNIDIFVFPDVNPDGKAYSQSHDRRDDPPDKQLIWWRYNRNPKPVPKPEDKPYAFKIGVDPNRNFNFLWQSGIGTEDGKGHSLAQSYKGEAPFSEPESINVKYMFDRFLSIRCFVDIHSHAGKILMSWGDDDIGFIYPEQNFRNRIYDGVRGIMCGDIEDDSHKPKPDFDYREYMHPLDIHTLTRYATKMSEGLKAVRGREYLVEPALGLYPTSGTSQDYAFSQRLPSDENRTRIFACTIEFGSSGENDDHLQEATFIPQYDPVMLNIINDICSAITELCFTVSSDVNPS